MGNFSERFIARIQERSINKANGRGPARDAPGLNPNKGKLHGACNRAACLLPGATYRNRLNGCYYCESCAGILNRANIDIPGGPVCAMDEAVRAEREAQALLRTLPGASARNKPRRL